MEKKELSIHDIISNLLGFVRLAKRNWWVFLVAMVLFGSLGYFLAARKETVYEVNATLGVKGKYWGGVQSSALALASQFGFSLGNSGAFEPDNKTIIGVSLSRQSIKSCLLQKYTINDKSTCLADQYVRLYKLHKKGEAPYQFKTESIYKILPSEDSLLEAIYDKISKKNVFVNLDEELGMVKLKVSSVDPKFSKNLSNRILDFMNRFFIENQNDNQSKSYQISKFRVDSIHAILQAKESQLAHLSDISMTSTKTSGHLQQMQLTRDVEILNKIYAEAIATLEVNKVVLGRDKSVMLTIDEPEFSIRIVHPNKKLYAIISAIIGLILTSLALLFFNYYRNNIRPISKA